MNTEYEVKILDIDTDAIRKALAGQGFLELPVKNFRRYIYTLKNDRNSWIRLRTDGSKTTLTLKKYISDTIDGVKELEIIVSDFEKTSELLAEAGYQHQSYQENRRTSFESKDEAIEICIDEWPKIPPYLEIEGKSIDEVHQYIDMLKLGKQAQTSAPTSEVYKHYGLDLGNFKTLAF